MYTNLLILNNCLRMSVKPLGYGCGYHQPETRELFSMTMLMIVVTMLITMMLLMNGDDYLAQTSRPSSPANRKTFPIPPTTINPYKKDKPIQLYFKFSLTHISYRKSISLLLFIQHLKPVFHQKKAKTCFWVIIYL